MRRLPNLILKLNFWIIFLIAAQVAAIIFLCVYVPSLLPLAFAFALVWLLSAISAAFLFTRSGAPEVKCVWFVIIAAFPVAGALIYLLASVKHKPSGILNVKHTETNGLSRAAAGLCGTVEAGYSKAEYFENGTDFFKCAVEEISKAQKHVYIEFFIVGRGSVLNEFIKALSKAVENGAEVKILLDGIGSAFRLKKRDYKQLKELGAEVKVFHRLIPVASPKINRRDHRKIIAVDGRVAFTGGVNLADEYANISSPYGYWKDTGVAVYGSVASIFEGIFLASWHGKYEMPAPEIQHNEKRCLPFYDSPPRRKFYEDALVWAVSSAKERVHVMTPYFCLSDKLSAALNFTARRGVDVKIIIPHIPDKKYAFEVSKAFAHIAGYSGVKVFEYVPGFMHAKCVICDDNVFLGSYNFDFRSTHFNFECGALFGNDVTEHVEKDFANSLALSTQLTAGKLSPAKRMSRFLLRFFSPLI
ncbi:MAG: hypothetical protein K2K80_02365 [Clostridia bacterium]|nr:hypothetical protein [Clostridia bacterium]